MVEHRTENPGVRSSILRPGIPVAAIPPQLIAFSLFTCFHYQDLLDMMTKFNKITYMAWAIVVQNVRALVLNETISGFLMNGVVL